MSVSQIIGSNGKILSQYLPAAAPAAGVQNPLTSTLQAYNPTQLVRHDITGAGTVEAAVVQTENLALVPGSLQTAIRVDESLELATAKRLEFQAAGEVAVAAGQSLTLGGTLVAPDVAAAGAPWTNVLGFDPITGAVEYQAAGGGGGGVQNPMTADLDCANYKLDAVQSLNFNAVAEINAAAGNDVNITGGVGATVSLDSGGVCSLTMNSATPGVSLKPDAGFCELALSSSAATLVSGDKNCKLVMTNAGGNSTATLQTSANRKVAIDETAQTVSLAANATGTALALNGSLGGSAAIAADGNTSIALGSSVITITADSDLKLVGTGLGVVGAGIGAGLYLRIWINGTPYKIQLFNDV